MWGCAVVDAKKMNFCQECGEFLIEKRLPVAEKALGETRPPKQRYCPQVQGVPGLGS